jgi:hypothetical protein
MDAWMEAGWLAAGTARARWRVIPADMIIERAGRGALAAPCALPVLYSSTGSAQAAIVMC